MTDLHTHILPRMDDGAPDTAASLAMLRMEAAQGVTGVALTPHFHRDRESIEQFLARRQAAWEHLSAAMEKTAEPFPDLVLGAEVAWMPNMNRWDDLEALCLGSSRYLLLELPFTLWNNSMIDQLYSLAAQSGVTPVLAHLERYLGRQKKEHIQELYRLNVPIQLSAGCLLHPMERWKLFRLLREGQSFFLASDCHGTQRRTPDLGPAAAVAKKRLTGDALETLLHRSDAIFTAATRSSPQRAQNRRGNMRRNENFILRRVADMSVIVPLGAAAEAFPGMISVNETGAFLWDLLEQEQTLQSLGDALCAVYSVEREQAEADAAAFLDKLRPVGAVDGL